MVMAEGKPVAPSPADADGDRRTAADGARLHLAFSDFGKAVLEGEKLVVVCHEGDGAVRSGIAVAIDGLDTGESFGEEGQHSFELRLCSDVSFGIDESPELAVVPDSRVAFAEGRRDGFVSGRDDFLALSIYVAPEILLVFDGQSSLLEGSTGILVGRGDDIAARHVDDAPASFFFDGGEAVFEEARFLIDRLHFSSVERKIPIGRAPLYDRHAVLEVGDLIVGGTRDQRSIFFIEGDLLVLPADGESAFLPDGAAFIGDRDDFLSRAGEESAKSAFFCFDEIIAAFIRGEVFRLLVGLGE